MRDFDMPEKDPDKEDETGTYVFGDMKAICPVQEEIEKLIKDRNKPHVCKHEWESYRGLSEEFEFCNLCDEKRSL